MRVGSPDDDFRGKESEGGPFEFGFEVSPASAFSFRKDIEVDRRPYAEEESYEACCEELDCAAAGGVGDVCRCGRGCASGECGDGPEDGKQKDEEDMVGWRGAHFGQVADLFAVRRGRCAAGRMYGCACWGDGGARSRFPAPWRLCPKVC